MVRRRGLAGWPGLLAALSCAAVAGCAGEIGPEGNPGPQGPPGPVGPQGPGAGGGSGGDRAPSISAVTPNQAFLARTAEVAISGFDTAWSDGVAVGFGDGVTVEKVRVASPTALVVTIRVDAGAAVGDRSVEVMQGEETLTYESAFSIRPPVAMMLEGSQAQGSIVSLRAQGLDFETPFDTTTTGDGFFTPLEFPHVKLTIVPGVGAIVNNVTPYAVEALLLLDVNATPGKKDLAILSGPPDALLGFPAPGALELAAREPTPLEPGKPIEAGIAAPFESAVYVLKPGDGLSLVDIAVQSGGEGAAPAFALLPKSGSFVDLIQYTDATTLVAKGADPYFVVYWDNQGASGYDYTIQANVTEVASGPEGEPNDGSNAALELESVPYVVTGAELADAEDEDWFAVNVGAGDVGKSIRVRTIPGDVYADPQVDVRDTDGVASLGGPSSDADYHEDFLSDPIEKPGTYFVKVFPSQYYDPTFTNYDLVVTFE